MACRRSPWVRFRGFPVQGSAPCSLLLRIGSANSSIQFSRPEDASAWPKRYRIGHLPVTICAALTYALPKAARRCFLRPAIVGNWASLAGRIRQQLSCSQLLTGWFPDLCGALVLAPQLTLCLVVRIRGSRSLAVLVLETKAHSRFVLRDGRVGRTERLQGGWVQSAAAGSFVRNQGRSRPAGSAGHSATFGREAAPKLAMTQPYYRLELMSRGID